MDLRRGRLSTGWWMSVPCGSRPGASPVSRVTATRADRIPGAALPAPSTRCASCNTSGAHPVGTRRAALSACSVSRAPAALRSAAHPACTGVTDRPLCTIEIAPPLWQLAAIENAIGKKWVRGAINCGGALDTGRAAGSGEGEGGRVCAVCGVPGLWAESAPPPPPPPLTESVGGAAAGGIVPCVWLQSPAGSVRQTRRQAGEKTATDRLLAVRVTGFHAAAFVGSVLNAVPMK